MFKGVFCGLEADARDFRVFNSPRGLGLYGVRASGYPKRRGALTLNHCSDMNPGWMRSGYASSIGLDFKHSR